jgi:hypothetical protein
MKNPLVYEINARLWLQELTAQYGAGVTLGQVPDAVFARWQNLGLTHIWLMGVWTTGPRSREHARHDPKLQASLREWLPDGQASDLVSSPFAIADYRVPRAWGGEAGLQAFRRKLHHAGLKLLLDFVPNHVGLDHPWLQTRPELFVQSPEPRPETFAAPSSPGSRWLAHGKDPNFPAWADTAQLDYRAPATHAALLELCQSLATRCDGVRCDMAMLVLRDMFQRHWASFPCAGPSTDREFWADVIPAVKARHPQFLFFAEVYWDLEAQLQTLGFDYTYDKRLYDFLVYRASADVHRHLAGVTPEFLARSAHFLENHDEPRIASILSLPEHEAAAVLTLSLPGLRLLHEGQLTGARQRTPVQLGRRPAEPVDSEVAAFYERFLTTLKASAVGSGRGERIAARPAWPGNGTADNLVVLQWQEAPETFDLVVVNLGSGRSQGYVTLTVPGLGQRNWRMRDLLGAEEYQRYGDDLQAQGLYLDLPPQGAQLFHFQPIF